MILRFLRLFPQFRALEASLAVERERAMRFDRDATQAQAAGVRAEQEVAFWKARAAEQDAEVRRLNAELIEKVANAADALSLGVHRRRLFNKAPVEAPPPEAHEPFTISSGGGKQFARDRVRQQTAKSREFFMNELRSANQPQPPTEN